MIFYEHFLCSCITPAPATEPGKAGQRESWVWAGGSAGEPGTRSLHEGRGCSCAGAHGCADRATERPRGRTPDTPGRGVGEPSSPPCFPDPSAAPSSRCWACVDFTQESPPGRDAVSSGISRAGTAVTSAGQKAFGITRVHGHGPEPATRGLGPLVDRGCSHTRSFEGRISLSWSWGSSEERWCFCGETHLPL